MSQRASNIRYSYWITQKLMEGEQISIKDVMQKTGFKYCQARAYLKEAERHLPVSTKRDGRQKVWTIRDSDLYSLTDKRRENE